MGSRLEFHEILSGVLKTRNVYFQPPENLKLQYPCIVYDWSSLDVHYADDIPYRCKRRYTVTVIDRNPDSEIPDRIAALPYCSFDRSYTADNLNHYVFNIYF